MSFILFLLLSNSYANSNSSLLIVEEIKKSIIKEYDLKESYKVIEETKYVEEQKAIKPKYSESMKKDLNQSRLEAQKRLGLPTDRALSGKERIELMKEMNRQKIKEQQKKKAKGSSGDWMEDKKAMQESFEQKNLNRIDSWVEEKKKILTSWKKAKEGYKKEIPSYKKNLTPIPTPVEYQTIKVPKKVQKKIRIEALNDYFIINKALEIPIKDQKRRPTCAAFAGVRGIEIKLTQKNSYRNLSEQYFYYLSKPKCQNKICDKGGSWPYHAYQSSKKSADFDLPSNKNCLYVGEKVASNDTQIPMASGCKIGSAKVLDFYHVKSNDEILNALNNQDPVIAGIRLSENFYTNRGHVFKRGSSKKGLDSHANGHAVVLVGYIKLPSSLHGSEGKYCFITANSWGLGWGKGGHACLSEKWFNKFRFDTSFLALSDAISR